MVSRAIFIVERMLQSGHSSCSPAYNFAMGHLLDRTPHFGGSHLASTCYTSLPLFFCCSRTWVLQEKWWLWWIRIWAFHYLRKVMRRTALSPRKTFGWVCISIVFMGATESNGERMRLISFVWRMHLVGFINGLHAEIYLTDCVYVGWFGKVMRFFLQRCVVFDISLGRGWFCAIIGFVGCVYSVCLTYLILVRHIDSEHCLRACRIQSPTSIGQFCGGV
jgi:hypothetical protein